MLRASGASSTHRPLGSITTASGILDRPVIPDRVGDRRRAKTSREWLFEIRIRKNARRIRRRLTFARHARPCAGHPRSFFFDAAKTWMAGTSPAMTEEGVAGRAGPPEPRNPHLLAAFLAMASWSNRGMARMKKMVVLVALTLSLTSVAAKAAERAGDAALGAISGAVVLGPIGAVAGAVVGYTAGPRISRSWRLRRSAASRGGRRIARQDAGAAVSDGQAASRSQASMTAPPRSPTYAGPPVQGFD